MKKILMTLALPVLLAACNSDSHDELNMRDSVETSPIAEPDNTRDNSIQADSISAGAADGSRIDNGAGNLNTETGQPNSVSPQLDNSEEDRK